MIVRRSFRKITYEFGRVDSQKVYNIILLFGFIPLYIHIDG